MWTSPRARWGAVLGFALGGFFDGILLHQILQWHHLLSLVPSVTDLRMQVLWDGYFHALMYVIAALGLWGLWRARDEEQNSSGRSLAGAFLIGFGVWHVMDGVLSHWVLGIHRIKMDSDNPLIWDLVWLVAFGVVPLVTGWLLARGGRGGGRPHASAMTAVFIGALTIGAGAWALRAPTDLPFTTAVFRPDLGPTEVMSALASADARLVWADAAMGVVVVDIPPEASWNLYRYGALLVGSAGVPAGCFAWSV